MSKQFRTIQDAIIIKNERSQPKKWHNQDTGEFKSLSFDICEVFSRKKSEGVLEPSFMYTKCTIWNEKIADKFMTKLDSIDPKHKTYITILNGVLIGFDEEKVDKETKDGKPYKATTYSNLRMNVSDFIITSKPINEQSTKDQDVEINQEHDNVTDDAIPF